MKNIKCINLKSKRLIINQDKHGNRIKFCYSDDGDCRECRYHKDCDWFLSENGFK